MTFDRVYAAAAVCGLVFIALWLLGVIALIVQEVWFT